MKTALRRWKCWLIQASRVLKHTNAVLMIDSAQFSDYMADSLHLLQTMRTAAYARSHAIKFFLHKNAKLIESEMCARVCVCGGGFVLECAVFLFDISITTCILTPHTGSLLNRV